MALAELCKIGKVTARGKEYPRLTIASKPLQDLGLGIGDEVYVEVDEENRRLIIKPFLPELEEEE